MTTDLFVRHETVLQPPDGDYGEELRRQKAQIARVLKRGEMVIAASERRRLQRERKQIDVALRLLARWEPCTPPATWHAGYLRSPLRNERLWPVRGGLLGAALPLIGLAVTGQPDWLILVPCFAMLGGLLGATEGCRHPERPEELRRLQARIATLPAASRPVQTEADRWWATNLQLFTAPMPRWALKEAKRAERIAGKAEVFVYSPRASDFTAVPVVVAGEPAIIARAMVGDRAYYFEVARWDVTADLEYLYSSKVEA